MPDVTQRPCAARGGMTTLPPQPTTAPPSHQPHHRNRHHVSVAPGIPGSTQDGVVPCNSGWGPSHPLGPRPLDPWLAGELTMPWVHDDASNGSHTVPR